MAIYAGETECQVIYVTKDGVALRVSSVWVGDKQVFPPANRQEIHVFTRDTQGYGRDEQPSYYAFTVPIPWWATAVDVVLIGAGEKGRDGTKSFSGGSDGAGGRSGAWKVATTALTNHDTAFVQLPKGNSVSPPTAALYMPTPDGVGVLVSTEGEGTTANSGSTGGSVTPRTRTEFGDYHSGGSGGSRNNPGKHPGGGGGGGQGSNLIGNPTTGRDGGDGYVWLRFRSDAPIDGGGFTLYLGTTGGAADQPVTDWAASIGKTRETITEITVPVEIIGPVMWRTFNGCTSLVSAPEMDTSQATDMEAIFDGCASLVNVPQYDTKNVTHVSRAFAGCPALKSLPPLDMRSADNIAGMFTGCTSLESVTLPRLGEAFGDGRLLNMEDTKLDAGAANALMQSLGTVPTSNQFPSELELPATAAGADTSIAASKNWQVTIG